jgi:hypothetical protein
MDVQGAELMGLDGASSRISDIKMIWLEVENIELYKNEPLKSDTEFFLIQKGFNKIKDTVYNFSWDQLLGNYDYFLHKKASRFIYRLLSY